jgi:hypothetical protein
MRRVCSSNGRYCSIASYAPRPRATRPSRATRSAASSENRERKYRRDEKPLRPRPLRWTRGTRYYRMHLELGLPDDWSGRDASLRANR